MSFGVVFVGGISWLTNVRSEVISLKDRFVHFERNSLDGQKINNAIHGSQGEIISKIDGKMDIMIAQLMAIQRRLDHENKNRGNSKD